MISPNPLRLASVSRAVLAAAPTALAIVILTSRCIWAQSNPVPLINQPLVPDAIPPGGQSFTLTVNGTGFVSGSVVQWNGATVATSYVSGSELTGTIPASEIDMATTGVVAVQNPGVGTLSNPQLLEVTDPTSSIAFGRTDISAPAGPFGIVSADFNGDGIPDLAFTATEAYVMLGNPDGTFGPAAPYTTGGTAYLLAVGDFNGDGKPDLAVTNYFENTLAILLGNGDGTFGSPITSKTAEYPLQVIVADFNRDGKLDAACVTANSGISILLGNGDGTFQPQVLAALSSPDWGAVGDFNGDGNLDLVATSFEASGVSLLLGNGDGTFVAPVSFSTGTSPGPLLVADFNGDGQLDVAAAGGATDAISLLLGNGDGTFQPYTLFPVGGEAGFMTAGDFNGDGKLDLSCTTSAPDGVSVLLGNGKGTFQPFVEVATGAGPYILAAQDFNRDGKLDLVSANFSANSLSVLLQQDSVLFSPGSLTFPVQTVQVKSSPETVQMANETSTTLAITAIVISGANRGDFSQNNNCGSTLGAGSSCTINVSFTPTARGTRTASVTVRTVASGTFSFLVQGIGSEAELSPRRLSFGSVVVGTSSKPERVTLSNIGLGPFNIANISFDGADGGDFSQRNDCKYFLAPGAACAIQVTFAPLGTGQRTASLAVVTTGGGSQQGDVTQYVDLLGTGVQ